MISIESFDITKAVQSAPDVTELTTGELDGSGIFDTLMRATKKHLDAEYRGQRITGKDYATVYLGALTAVLRESVQFAVSYRQAEKLSAEIGLLRQQTVTELAKTDDTILDGLGFNDGTDIAGLMAAQIAQTEKEGMLIEQKTQTELVQTAGYCNLNIGYNITNDIAGVTRYAIDKINAETELLEQKTTTELAQVADSAAASGLIAKQRVLLERQADGFLRDAEQKASKILLDAWSVARTTNDTVNVGESWDNSSIDDVIEKMGAGIGVTIT